MHTSFESLFSWAHDAQWQNFPTSPRALGELTGNDKSPFADPRFLKPAATSFPLSATAGGSRLTTHFAPVPLRFVPWPKGNRLWH